MVVSWLARGMADVPASDGWLAPPEAARLESLQFPKRRTEARLARWTAKQAVVRALDFDDDSATLAAIEIRTASTGAPMIFVRGEPSPVAVSMTDRADWAVCAVSHAPVAIGCDLELVEPRSALFVSDWFTPAERGLVGQVPAGPRRDLLCNLVWSAKESALKVLQTGLRRDTRSVAVDVVDSDGEGRWARLVVRSEEGAQFPGWWRRYGDFVLTVASDVVLEPPASFENPSRLAGATPSHGWMPQ